MKITVITVCFNACATIEKTIQSVINQTYDNLEYIIVDGGSADGTIDVIKKYRSKIAKFVSEPDRGIYDAMNKGSRLATGDWVLFMNSGDEFAHGTVVENIVGQIEKDADVVYGDNFMIYDSKTIYHKARFFSDHDINLPFNHQSAFVRTELAKQHPFDLNYKIAGDYHFFYNLYRADRRFQYVPFPVANYSMDGMSQKHVIRTFREVSDIQGRNKGVAYVMQLGWLYVKGLLKCILPDSIACFIRSLMQHA